jgi:hypothetical protein
VLGVELRCLDVIGFTRVLPAAGGAPQLTATGVSGDNFLLALSGSAGATYVVQVSSNLATWLPVSTNLLPASGFASVTNGVGSSSSRFYRALLE